MSFSKSWNCTSRFGECNFAFWKTHKCKLIPNWTRKTVWLPINNINEKNCVKDVLNLTDSELSSQFCARAKPQVILIITQSRKNCTIIAPSRARAWFENKKVWLAIYELLCSLTNQNACFITFFCIQLPLFCTVLRKSCTVLSQSESSNFFMYINKYRIKEFAFLYVIPSKPNIISFPLPWWFASLDRYQCGLLPFDFFPKVSKCDVAASLQRVFWKLCCNLLQLCFSALGLRRRLASREQVTRTSMGLTSWWLAAKEVKNITESINKGATDRTIYVDSFGKFKLADK